MLLANYCCCSQIIVVAHKLLLLLLFPTKKMATENTQATVMYGLFLLCIEAPEGVCYGVFESAALARLAVFANSANQILGEHDQGENGILLTTSKSDSTWNIKPMHVNAFKFCGTVDDFNYSG
jgi:hypothetical protein